MIELEDLASLLEAAAVSLRKAAAELRVVKPVTVTPITCLSVRSRKILRRMGVEELEGASQFSAADLLEQKNCGRVSVQEISKALAGIGRTLKRSPYDPDWVQYL